MRQQIDSLQDELQKFRNQCFEIEAGRDKFELEAERNQRLAEDREKLLEKANSELCSIKEQFDDYKKKCENDLDGLKQNNRNLDSLAVELERSRNKVQEMENVNQMLQEDNRTLSLKVEELREDIEGKCRVPLCNYARNL